MTYALVCMEDVLAPSVGLMSCSIATVAQRLASSAVKCLIEEPFMHFHMHMFLLFFMQLQLFWRTRYKLGYCFRYHRLKLLEHGSRCAVAD